MAAYADLLALSLRGAAYADLLQHTGSPFKRVGWHDLRDIRLQYTLQYNGAPLTRVERHGRRERNSKLMRGCLRRPAYAELTRRCLRGLVAVHRCARRAGWHDRRRVMRSLRGLLTRGAYADPLTRVRICGAAAAELLTRAAYASLLTRICVCGAAYAVLLPTKAGASSSTTNTIRGRRVRRVVQIVLSKNGGCPK